MPNTKTDAHPTNVFARHREWEREQNDRMLIDVLDRFRNRTNFGEQTALPAVRFQDDGSVVITAFAGHRREQVKTTTYISSGVACVAYQTLLDFLGAKPDVSYCEETVVGDEGQDQDGPATYPFNADQDVPWAGVDECEAEDDGRISAVFMHYGRKVAEFYDLASAIGAIRSMVEHN